MINEQFTCAREECDNKGVKTTHNQKYCSPECCRIATNAKIMEKYHERAAIRKGKPRSCRGCGTALSRYNDTKLCSLCQTGKSMRDTQDEALRKLLENVSFV